MSKHRRYPVRIPRFAPGIRAQETRSGGRCWWAKRWLATLEAMRLGEADARGRLPERRPSGGGKLFYPDKVLKQKGRKGE